MEERLSSCLFSRGFSFFGEFAPVKIDLNFNLVNFDNLKMSVFGGGRVARVLKGVVPHPRNVDVPQAPVRSKIREEKDKHFRALLLAREGFQSVFSDLPSSGGRDELNKTRSNDKRVREALGIYRLLRPDAPPSYVEDAMSAMSTKLSSVSNSSEKSLEISSELGDPFMTQLPVVNPRAFIIALEAAVNSLADDLHAICADFLKIPGDALPRADHPERFKILVNVMMSSFPLKKSPEHVDEFLMNHWSRLQAILPPEIGNLSNLEIGNWLRDHLTRVQRNQKSAKHPRQRAMYYSISEDFIFDTWPVGPELKDERNLEFPLEKASEYLEKISSFFGIPCSEGMLKQWQQLIWDCEKIGLRNWLKLDELQHVEKWMPEGTIGGLAGATPEDLKVAKLMLRCAARGKPNLLDFEAIDPYKLMNNFPTASVEEEISRLPENPMLSDSQIDELFDLSSATAKLAAPAQPSKKLHAFLEEHGSTPVDAVLEAEKKWATEAGAVKWESEGETPFDTWKWKTPDGTFYDERRDAYIRQQASVDPNLNLSQMRQHTLETTKLHSMTSSGRVYYFRTLVLVGNGQGVYGFGIGHGNQAKDAAAQAVVKALQNLKFLDFDATRTIPFPVKGREYGAKIEITPLRNGKGIHCTRRYLAIPHLIGLDNIRFRYSHARWMTRFRALDRALVQIRSRRTLANSTGKKYADITAPGDSWVHWPDRWFSKLADDNVAKSGKLEKMRKMLLKDGRSPLKPVAPFDVKPGWSKNNNWKSPLIKWSEQMAKEKILRKRVVKNASEISGYAEPL